MTSPPNGQGSCPLCSSTHRVPFITGFDRLYPRPENHDYVKCTSCGLISISPMPAAEIIASYYGRDYDPHGGVTRIDVERRLSRSFNRFLIRHRLDTNVHRSGAARYLLAPMARLGMRDTLTPTGECRLLDVGCGSGGWLYKHKLLGWEAHGVELVREAWDRSRGLGLQVYLGDIFAVPRDKRFDVISFRSVLEHIPDPVETMERAGQLLAPGGRILVMAPNIDSWGFRRYGINWYPLDPPRHLLQLTPGTITRLGQRAGLRPVSIETRASTRWILYSRLHARVFPQDILERRDPETRAAFIETAKGLRKRPSAMDRLYRRGVSLRAWWEARRGRGEMIYAVFTKGRIHSSSG